MWCLWTDVSGKEILNILDVEGFPKGMLPKQELVRNRGSGICTQSSLLKFVADGEEEKKRRRRTDQVTYRALGSHQSQKPLYTQIYLIYPHILIYTQIPLYTQIYLKTHVCPYIRKYTLIYLLCCKIPKCT